MAADGIDPDRNTERGRELRNRFVGEKDPASLVERSRLHLNATDDAFYQDYLIQLRDPLNLRRLPTSNRRLHDCFRYFVVRLQELDELRNDGNATAGLFSETVARQLIFILITVDDELNAYTVFETLNARGLELTATDLLKNHIFSLVRVGADLAALQRRWGALVETVGQPRFPEFLRYHLLCRQPSVRSQRLFKLVRDRTWTAAQVFALLAELEGRAELFAALLDANHSYWLDPAHAKPHVATLNLLGVRQPLPLLFAAWESFSGEDFTRVLKLVGVISFRYSVVSGLNPNALEPVYHRAAKAVADGGAPTPAAIFERLQSIYVNDEKMRQDFARLDVGTKGPRRKLAKYILARLEQDAAGRVCDPETDPGTIEHILPENPAETWAEMYPPDKWENGVNRLGNLTLIEAPANKDVGNKAYPDKLAAYAGSTYALTRRIAAMAPEEWTPEFVNVRQIQLAARAVHVWRADFA